MGGVPTEAGSRGPGLRSLEYLSWSSHFRGPQPIISEQGVGDDDQFAHDSDDGDLCGFSSCAECQVFCIQRWIEADGDQGGHIERLPQGGASALDETLAAPAS